MKQVSRTEEYPCLTYLAPFSSDRTALIAHLYCGLGLRPPPCVLPLVLMLTTSVVLHRSSSYLSSPFKEIFSFQSIVLRTVTARSTSVCCLGSFLMASSNKPSKAQLLNLASSSSVVKVLSRAQVWFPPCF